MFVYKIESRYDWKEVLSDLGKNAFVCNSIEKQRGYVRSVEV